MKIMSQIKILMFLIISIFFLIISFLISFFWFWGENAWQGHSWLLHPLLSDTFKAESNNPECSVSNRTAECNSVIFACTTRLLNNLDSLYINHTEGLLTNHFTYSMFTLKQAKHYFVVRPSKATIKQSGRTGILLYDTLKHNMASK